MWIPTCWENLVTLCRRNRIPTSVADLYLTFLAERLWHRLSLNVADLCGFLSSPLNVTVLCVHYSSHSPWLDGDKTLGFPSGRWDVSFMTVLQVFTLHFSFIKTAVIFYSPFYYSSILIQQLFPLSFLLDRHAVCIDPKIISRNQTDH